MNYLLYSLWPIFSFILLSLVTLLLGYLSYTLIKLTKKSKP